LEHTGDAAIEIIADSREQLFADAMVGMARLMVEENGIERRETRTIFAPAGADTETLRDLLAKALNLFLTEGFIWRDAEIVFNGNSDVTAELAGERVDARRHQFLGELKAVTYHQLQVERVGPQWRAVVVFDA
jgi:SHS2 domain-containing protein